MIDQEIQDALKVDPSPEFLARVRTRIASEPAPSGWRWSWAFAAAVAMAAAVIVAIVLSPVREKSIVAPGAQTAEAGPKGPALHPTAEGPTGGNRPAPFGPGAVRQGAPVAQAFGPAVRRPDPVVSGSSRTLSAKAEEPEILLDAAETRALRGLIAGVRYGRVDLTPLVNNAPPAPMELQPIDDIVIAPITVEPLAPQGAQGERQ